MDTAVVGKDLIFGGSGTIDAMMRLTPEELLRVSGAEAAELSEF